MKALFEKGEIKVKLSKIKINMLMARKQLTVTALAKRSGVSRSRMTVILSNSDATPICAGKLAQALEVDVTEILED